MTHFTVKAERTDDWEKTFATNLEGSLKFEWVMLLWNRSRHSNFYTKNTQVLPIRASTETETIRVLANMLESNEHDL